MKRNSFIFWILFFLIQLFSYPLFAYIEVKNIKIFSYNLFLMPALIAPQWQQLARAKLMIQSDLFEDYDILVLNELFETSSKYALTDYLNTLYPFRTPILGESLDEWDKTHGILKIHKIISGGVIVFSKWPIVNKEQFIYTNGCGPEEFANKGFIYVKINKRGEFIHLFATHTQSEENTCFPVSPRTVRESQFKEIRNFIDKLNIPDHELIVIAGDLNVNLLENPNLTDSDNHTEYAQMIGILGADVPKLTGFYSTWDPKSNSIAGGIYPNLNSEFLDYVLNIKQKSVRIISSELNVLYPKSPTWRTIEGFIKNDYSDHYPVRMKMTYTIFKVPSI